MSQTITAEQLEQHKRWWLYQPGGVRLVLNNADLRGADLRGADLSHAGLRGAVGNMREVKSAQFDAYFICWWQPPEGGQILQIGCQCHPLTEWQSADPQWIAKMAHGATEWWAKYGPVLLQLVEASPAVWEPLNLPN